MKTLDIVAAVLLIIGGLNWGLVGLFNFDLVAAIAGEMTVFSRIIYGLVGLSAVYQAAQQGAIRERWGLTLRRAA